MNRRSPVSHRFVDLSLPGPDAVAVVPLRGGRLELEVAQRIAGTVVLIRSEVVLSDGRWRAPASEVAALLQLRGDRLQVQCFGSEARRAVELVTQQVRGVRGSLLGRF